VKGGREKFLWHVKKALKQNKPLPPKKFGITLTSWNLQTE